MASGLCGIGHDRPGLTDRPRLDIRNTLHGLNPGRAFMTRGLLRGRTAGTDPGVGPRGREQPPQYTYLHLGTPILQKDGKNVLGVSGDVKIPLSRMTNT